MIVILAGSVRSIIFYGNPSVFSSVYIYLHSRKILKTKSNQENFIILFQFCDAILCKGRIYDVSTILLMLKIRFTICNEREI